MALLLRLIYVTSSMVCASGILALCRACVSPEAAVDRMHGLMVPVSGGTERAISRLTDGLADGVRTWTSKTMMGWKQPVQ